MLEKATRASVLFASAAALLALASSCFDVRDFEDGVLRCDLGRCPPGMECRQNNLCYRPGRGDAAVPPPTDGLPSADAAGAADGRVDGSGGPAADAAAIDAPIVSEPDAGEACTVGEHRCVADNLEICTAGSWTPLSPSCGQQSLHCFDPGPTGGTDAYCGSCLTGGQRCRPAPPVRQVCMNGTWIDAEPCDAALGCYDPDGPDGAQAYCGVCSNGDTRCNGRLETCAAGQWPLGVDCSVTPGWSCFDPSPPGGNDTYCGLCLANGFVCHGDARDQCNGDGTAFGTVESCNWGCQASAGACCAAPTCGTRVCGSSPMNACGRAIGCGTCSGTDRCVAGQCEPSG